MNLAWITALSIAVAVEKMPLVGELLASAFGPGLIAESLLKLMNLVL